VRLVLAAAPALLVVSACPSLDPFTCQGDDQCTLAADGVCHEDEGACSYPDDTCPSSHRWSQTAGALAGTCVDEEPATTGIASTSSGAASSSDAASSSGSLPAECGNGAVEGDEECDDGDAPGCNACTADCHLAGQLRWSATLDGMGFTDFFDSAVVDPSGDVIVVGRAGSGPDDEDQDRFVARYDAAGELRWTMHESTPGRDDLNCVVLGPGGEVIAGGLRTTGGVEEIWVGRYDEGVVEDLLAYGDFELLATMGNTCMLTPDGRLVVGGTIDGGGAGFERWDRLVLDDALGAAPEPFVIGGPVALSEARDLVYSLASRPDGAVLAAGNVTRTAKAAADRWIASFDAEGTWLGELVEGGAGQGVEEVLGLAVDGDVVYAVGSKVFNAGGTERTWVAALAYDGLSIDWDVELPLDPPAVVVDVALDAQGNLVVAANLKDIGTRLVMLDPTAEGECQWMVEAPGGAGRVGTVVVGPDGGLVIAGADTPDDTDATDALVASLSP
jgi:hypothetical protein